MLFFPLATYLFVFFLFRLVCFNLILLLFSSFLILDTCLFSNETGQERMWIWVNREESRNQIILYEKKSISNLKKRIEYCTLRGSLEVLPRLQNELLGSLVVNREDKWLGLNMGARGMIGKRKTGDTGQSSVTGVLRVSSWPYSSATLPQLTNQRNKEWWIANKDFFNVALSGKKKGSPSDPQVQIQDPDTRFKFEQRTGVMNNWAVLVTVWPCPSPIHNSSLSYKVGSAWLLFWLPPGFDPFLLSTRDSWGNLFP